MTTNKISLAEAAKQLLAQKKNAQAAGSANQKNTAGQGPAMKSQINKKPNNQKRRTGV